MSRLNNLPGGSPVSTIQRVLLWVGPIILVALVITSVGLHLLFGEVSRPGESTAEFIPAGVPSYASLNLRPGVSQLYQARDFFTLLNTEDFKDRQDELLEDLEDDSGIHFLDDVTSWLGRDVSVALLNCDLEEPEWVVLVQIRDREAATVFARDLVEYLEGELDTEFSHDNSEGTDLWTSTDEPLALAVADDYLLMGDGGNTLTETVGNLASPPSPPLSEDESFVSARAAVPDQRVFFAFVQPEVFFEEFFEEFKDVWVVPYMKFAGVAYGDASEVTRQIGDASPEYVAASVAFVKDGVRLDIVSDASSDLPLPANPNGLRSAEVLPADTLMLLSAVGIPEAWDESRSIFRDTEPDLDESLEEFLLAYEDDVGIDLERDVVESLSAEVVLALLQGEIPPDTGFGGVSGAIEALDVADLSEPLAVRMTLDSLVELLEEAGFDVQRDSLGEYKLVTTDLGGFADMVRAADMVGDLRLGNVVTDDREVMGSNVEDVRRSYAASIGESDSLSSSAKFSRLTTMAPDPLRFLFYLDIAGTLSVFEAALDDNEMAEYRDTFQPFLRPLNTSMMAVSADEEISRLTAVLTLRK